MLNDVRVLDLAAPESWLAGQLLADMGATVELWERPTAAQVDTFWRQAYASSKIQRRIDWLGDTPRLLAQLEGADVVIESMGASWFAAIGMPRDVFAARFPHLVHVTIRVLAAQDQRPIGRPPILLLVLPRVFSISRVLQMGRHCASVHRSHFTTRQRMQWLPCRLRCSHESSVVWVSTSICLHNRARLTRCSIVRSTSRWVKRRPCVPARNHASAVLICVVCIQLSMAG